MKTHPTLAAFPFAAVAFAAGFGPHLAVAQDAVLAAPAVALEDPFLLTEPQSLEEFFRGAYQALQLGRPNLARQYLQGFVAANPSDDDLLALRDAFGPGPFARLAAAKELRPLSTDLAARVDRVFRQRGANPERLNTLIDDYLARNERAGTARVALIGAGSVAVPQVLARLRAERDDYLAGRLLDLIAGIGEPAVPALHAALDATDLEFRTQVLSVLGRIGSRRSVPFLLSPAYSPQEPPGIRQTARTALANVIRLARVPAAEAEPADVAKRLAEEASRSWTDPAPPADPNEEPAAGRTVWTWDAATGTVGSATVDPTAAALLRGSKFAGQAFRLAPDRPELQALYLAFRLALETRNSGRPIPPAGQGPVFHAALAAGPGVTADALAIALKYDMPAAALPALAILGQTLAPSTAFAADGPILAALNSADPRVELAAAVAALQIAPEKPFPGSRRVVEILTRALSTADVPTALVIDQNPQRAATIAGFVREFGYDAAVATTGQTGFVLASGRTPAFVLVNLNVVRWPLSQTLANFRADPRTRSLPVLVYGPTPGSWDSHAGIRTPRLLLASTASVRNPRGAVEESLSTDARTAYLTETVTSQAFAGQMRPVLAALVPEPMSAEERNAGRATAAYWLARIADTRLNEVFSLDGAEPALLSAISDPALAENALVALSFRPTEAAQKGIAGAVLAAAMDESARRRAAAELIGHIRRYGLLIDDGTVAALYKLWESTPDDDLRTILAAFGGVLRPDGTRVETLLRNLPPAAVSSGAP